MKLFEVKWLRTNKHPDEAVLIPTSSWRRADVTLKMDTITDLRKEIDVLEEKVRVEFREFLAGA